MIRLAEHLEPIIQAALPTVAPAISLAVYQHGSHVLSKAWGWVDPETKQCSATTATLFDLASLTKIFTTTALLVLAKQHAVSLQTPLHRFIPEFAEHTPRPLEPEQNPHTRQYAPLAPTLVGQAVNPREVTLWHLLTHTSGLAPWRDFYQQQPPPTDLTETDTRQRWQQALPNLFHAPFVDHVGATVHYSDLGLLLLGEVVSRLHQSTLNTAIKAHVLAALSPHNLSFNPLQAGQYAVEQIAPTEFDTSWRQQRVWGIVHDENAAAVGGVAGHAGLFGTVDDVARFGRGWLQHTFALSAEHYAQATSQQACTGQDRRGLGWMLRSEHNSSAGDLMSMDAYGHTGFTGTSLWIDPQHAVVVALLSNRVYYGRDPGGIHKLRRVVHNAIMEALA